MSLNNFWASVSILTNFFQTTCREAGMIMRVQLLEVPPQKFPRAKKNVQNSARFLTTFDFDRKYLRTGSTYRISEKNFISRNPFHVGRKNLVNFGPQTRMFYWLILTNPRRYFSENYISAIRGCCALKFLNALQIDQGYLVHAQAGTGVPKKFNCENLKLGLKFNV